MPEIRGFNHIPDFCVDHKIFPFGENKYQISSLLTTNFVDTREKIEDLGHNWHSLELLILYST